MKKILTAVILLIGINHSVLKALGKDDFESLSTYLNKEDWKTAYKESAKLLKSAENDTSDYRASILYINLISAAGMVTNGQMSYKELDKNIMKYQGQKIIMTPHQVTMKDGAFGKIKFTASETHYEAFTSATNAKKVNILCFEKFILKDKININEMQEANVSCGGILEKIETNPSQSITWILRLTVKDAFARKI